MMSMLELESSEDALVRRVACLASLVYDIHCLPSSIGCCLLIDYGTVLYTMIVSTAFDGYKFLVVILSICRLNRVHVSSRAIANLWSDNGGELFPATSLETASRNSHIGRTESID